MECCHDDNTQYALWHYLLLKAVKTLENVSHFCPTCDNVLLSGNRQGLNKPKEWWEIWVLTSCGEKEMKKTSLANEISVRSISRSNLSNRADNELYLAKYIAHLFFGFYAKRSLIFLSLNSASLVRVNILCSISCTGFYGRYLDTRHLIAAPTPLKELTARSLKPWFVMLLFLHIHFLFLFLSPYCIFCCHLTAKRNKTTSHLNVLTY